MTPEELSRFPDYTLEKMQDIIDNYADRDLMTLPWRWLVGFLAILLVGLALWRHLRRRKQALLAPRPKALFEDSLRVLKTLLKDPQAFYLGARTAINAFVHWKTRHAVEALTNDELKQQLSETPIPRDTQSLLASILDRHTSAVFAGQSVSVALVLEDYEQLDRLKDPHPTLSPRGEGKSSDVP